MRRSKSILILSLIVGVFLSGPAPAQDSGLEDLSRKLRAKRTARREYALDLAERYGWPVAESLPGGVRFSLQGVYGGMPQYFATCNADAAVSTGTGLVQGAVGGGTGFRLGLWDAGKIRVSHQELAGRAYWNEPSGNLNDHSTHVAGTLVAEGVKAQARGMSYDADVYAYDWNYDDAEMAAEAGGGLTISNHSYSYIRGWYENTGIFNPGWYWYGDSTVSETEDYYFGFYDSLSMDADDIANAAPDYLIVVAAANNRDDDVPAPGTEHYYYHYGDSLWRKSTKVRDPDGGVDGYDCLPNGKQVAKNTLAVGAVEDVEAYTGPGDVIMTGFSSWGPTDDGRIKPDIVGNGWELYSCVTQSDTAYYGGASGTSMASPNVCGSLGLIQDYYMDQHSGTPMKAATLKALAIHTAREAGPAPGPDYMFGWGLLDANAAYGQAVEDLDDSKGLIEELTLNDGAALEYHYWCDGTASELRATICWSDPSGVPPDPAVDPPNIMLVNDLDLRVSLGETEHRPWRLDPAAPGAVAARGDNFRDNVEQVLIDNPSEGIYAITIDHKSWLEGGSQDFSLIVSGAERSEIWHVYQDGSGDAPDISSAVSSAAEGDVILVHAGTYNENDISVGKTLSITGVDGRGATVVDAQSLGRCFQFNALSGASLLEGFTLRNGGTSGPVRGAGLSCQSSGVTIRDCVVENCAADYAGGMHFSYADATVEDCVIRNCSSNDYGGGVYLYFSSPSFDHCLIYGSSAATSGGAISCYESSPVLTRCTISHNSAAGHGGGIYIGYDSHPELVNTIVSFSTDGEGVYGPASAIPGLTATCSDVYGNADGNYGGSISNKTGINGNISEDPLYCGADTGEFGLQGVSPCLPGGNSCGAYMGALGMACHTRSLWYVEAGGAGDAATIQAAIDSAIAGDTVLVASGTYTGGGNRDIKTNGKPILVASESGRDVTIIDCASAPGDNHYGFKAMDNEDTTTVVRGFTVTRASNAGVYINQSGPIIEDCLLTANTPYDGDYGGGVIAMASTSIIRNCVVSADSTRFDGGGILCFGPGTDMRIEDCDVAGNGADHYGGGICVKQDARAVITGCWISGNLADEFGGGVYIEEGSRAVIEGCVICDNSSYSGAGVNALGKCEITETVINGNTASMNGGGVFSADSLSLFRCTIIENDSPYYGSGVYCDGDSTDFTNTIVAFNTTGNTAGGIYSNSDTIFISCCDVYGNEHSDYAGGISDQTGLNNNISQDPLFCGPGSGDYHIFDDSPCAPDHSPCGELIGNLGVNCYGAPDLVFDEVAFSRLSAPAGSGITATVKVKNIGASTADSFYVEFFHNRTSPPVPGSHGHQRLRADSLAVGDSLLWTTGPVSSSTINEYRSYFQLDSDGYVTEKDEGNNIDGPNYLSWYAPVKPGWPVAGGGDFVSSPVLASLDDDPRTLEVVVGCDDGKLYAWTADGDTLPGSWPVHLGSAVGSSPAAGNITGDYRAEIVVGCADGSLYALDHTGKVLWSVVVGEPVNTTPALADLDGDGLLDIVIGGMGSSTTPRVLALDGDGGDMPGAWPLKLTGTSITSASVGDVNDDGGLEIAVITSGITKPSYHSDVHLFDAAGSVFSSGWPVAIDTAIVAAPVLGNIAGTSADLEIVAGALNGEVYVINLAGTVWPTRPRVPGRIERSPALIYSPKSSYHQIAVSSRYWESTMPPMGVWRGVVTLIDHNASIVSGWPNSAGYWGTDYGAVPSPLDIGDILIAATQERAVYSWSWMDGQDMPAFPRNLNRRPLSTPAAGDIDGDGTLDLVVTGSPDSVYCLSLCSSAYSTGKLYWPMFRNGAERTGCFYQEDLTGIEDDPENAIPSVTRIQSIYPNPFNPMTHIKFGVKSREKVRLAVYDVRGRLVSVIADRMMEPGVHIKTWNGRNTGGEPAASGIYFCRLRAGGFTETRKIVLLR